MSRTGPSTIAMLATALLVAVLAPPAAGDYDRANVFLRIIGPGLSSFDRAGDIDADGRADVVVGRSDDDPRGRADAGSAYVVFASAGPGTMDLGPLGPHGFRIDGARAGDRAGSGVAGPGDVNGDGRDDLVLTAPGADHAGVDAGSAYVIFGRRSTRAVDLRALAGRGFRIDGLDAEDSVSAAGDVNGDGRDDLLINLDLGFGPVIVVFGKATGSRVDLGALGAGGDVVFDEATGHDAAGKAAGDVNGDGTPDFVIGGGSHVEGVARVVFGRRSADAPAHAISIATSTNYRAPRGGGGTGDFNDDGLADFSVQVAGDEGGDAAVVFGTTEPVDILDGFRIDQGADGGPTGVAFVDSLDPEATIDLRAAGDADGDGRDDDVLAVRFSSFGTIFVHVVYGDSSFAGRTLPPTGSSGVQLAMSDLAFAAAAGDVDGDGRDDVLLHDEQDDPGALVVLRVPAPACTRTGTPGRETLTGTPGPDVLCAGAGDDTLHGLGGDDLLLGGPGRDRLFGGDGRDDLAGGDGDDQLSGQPGDDVLKGDRGRDDIRGGTGDDDLQAGAGDDRLRGDGGVDALLGDAGDDRLEGGPDGDGLFGVFGRDVALGDSGLDHVDGGPGADLLVGDAGNDRLDGAAGDDRLIAGDGADELRGGLGADAHLGGDGNDALDSLETRRFRNFSEPADPEPDDSFCGPGRDTLSRDFLDTALACEEVAR